MSTIGVRVNNVRVNQAGVNHRCQGEQSRCPALVLAIGVHLPDAFASASPRCLQHARILNAVAAFQSLLHTVDTGSLVHIHRDDTSAVFVRHTDVGATPRKGGHPSSLGQNGGPHLKMQNSTSWHKALEDNGLLS